MNVNAEQEDEGQQEEKYIFHIFHYFNKSGVGIQLENGDFGRGGSSQKQPSTSALDHKDTIFDVFAFLEVVHLIYLVAKMLHRICHAMKMGIPTGVGVGCG